MGGPPDIPPDLADRFFDRLRMFAARRVRDRAAAEDVAQEALRRVMEALQAGRIENPEALPAFVFQTARHVCQHHERGTARRERAFTRLAGEDRARPPAADPLSALLREERRRQVRVALDALAPADREILQLFYVRGLETETIASKLGVDPGAVRVRKHRATRRLEEQLTDTAGGNEPLPTGTQK